MVPWSRRSTVLGWVSSTSDKFRSLGESTVVSRCFQRQSPTSLPWIRRFPIRTSNLKRCSNFELPFLIIFYELKFVFSNLLSSFYNIKPPLRPCHPRCPQTHLPRRFVHPNFTSRPGCFQPHPCASGPHQEVLPNSPSFIMDEIKEGEPCVISVSPWGGERFFEGLSGCLWDDISKESSFMNVLYLILGSTWEGMQLAVKWGRGGPQCSRDRLKDWTNLL